MNTELQAQRKQQTIESANRRSQLQRRGNWKLGEKEFNKSYLPDCFQENRKVEQYVFTKQTTDEILAPLLQKYSKVEFQEKVLLIGMPSLAVRLNQLEINATLLEVDDRFDYLPGFINFDLQKPESCNDEKILNNKFEVILFDPPFMLIPMEELRKSVDFIIQHSQVNKIQLQMAFLKEKTPQLLLEFSKYGLKPTELKLQYAGVMRSMWKLYSWLEGEITTTDHNGKDHEQNSIPEPINWQQQEFNAVSDWITGGQGIPQTQSDEVQHTKFELDWQKIKELTEGSNAQWMVDNILRNDGLHPDKNEADWHGEYNKGGKVLHPNCPIQLAMMSSSDRTWLTQEIQSLQEKGVVRRTKKSKLEHVCPIFVAKNKEKNRMVFNMTPVNYKYAPEQFSLPSPTMALAHPRHAFFGNIDIKGAYHHIKFSENFKRYFGFQWNDQYFMFEGNPFGWNCAPWFWCTIFENTLQGIWQQMLELEEFRPIATKVSYIVYVDDILFSGEREHLVNKVMKHVIDKLTSLGFCIAHEKTNLAKKSAEFLGFIISQECINIKPEFKQLLNEEIDNAQKGLRPKPMYSNVYKIADYSVNDWLSLIGLIGHFARVCPQARSLQQKLSANFDSELRQTTAIKALGIPYNPSERELEITEQLKQIVNQFQGYRIKQFKQTYEFYADASLENDVPLMGWANKRCSPSSPQFHKTVKGIAMKPLEEISNQTEDGVMISDLIGNYNCTQANIAEWESIAVTLAFKRILEETNLKEVNLVAYSDNQVTCLSFSKKSSTSQIIQNCIDEILTLCDEFNINFAVRYIHTSQNSADFFSREKGKTTLDSWSDLIQQSSFNLRTWEIIRKDEGHTVFYEDAITQVLNRLQSPKTHYLTWQKQRFFLSQHFDNILVNKSALLTTAFSRLLLSHPKLLEDEIMLALLNKLRAHNFFSFTRFEELKLQNKVTEKELATIRTASPTAKQKYEKTLNPRVTKDKNPSNSSRASLRQLSQSTAASDEHETVNQTTSCSDYSNYNNQNNYNNQHNQNQQQQSQLNRQSLTGNDKTNQDKQNISMSVVVVVNNLKLTVKCSPEETVQDLKQKISKVSQIPEESFRVIIPGGKLKYNSSLKDNKIKNNTRLILIKLSKENKGPRSKNQPIAYRLKNIEKGKEEWPANDKRKFRANDATIPQVPDGLSSSNRSALRPNIMKLKPSSQATPIPQIGCAQQSAPSLAREVINSEIEPEANQGMLTKEALSVTAQSEQGQKAHQAIDKLMESGNSDNDDDDSKEIQSQKLQNTTAGHLQRSQLQQSSRALIKPKQRNRGRLK